MSAQDDSQEKWINPLLEKFDLLRPQRVSVDLRVVWAELEEFRVPERIRAMAANINRQARRCILDVVDYLPPQRTVVCVIYTLNKIEFVMAVVLRSVGSAVVFQSERVVTTRWGYYLAGGSAPREPAVEIMRGFSPSEITDEMMQGWFSFLVSGFSKEFEPGLNRQPRHSQYPKSNTPSRKASA